MQSPLLTSVILYTDIIIYFSSHQPGESVTPPCGTGFTSHLISLTCSRNNHAESSVDICHFIHRYNNLFLFTPARGVCDSPLWHRFYQPSNFAHMQQKQPCRV